MDVDRFVLKFFMLIDVELILNNFVLIFFSFFFSDKIRFMG